MRAIPSTPLKSSLPNRPNQVEEYRNRVRPYQRAPHQPAQVRYPRHTYHDVRALAVLKTEPRPNRPATTPSMILVANCGLFSSNIHEPADAPMPAAIPIEQTFMTSLNSGVTRKNECMMNRTSTQLTKPRTHAKNTPVQLRNRNHASPTDGNPLLLPRLPSFPRKRESIGHASYDSKDNWMPY